MIEIEKMVFGFELEGLFYDPNNDLYIQGYHSGEFRSTGFKMESDSTVEPNEDDRMYSEYENEAGDRLEDEDGEYTSDWIAGELINKPLSGFAIHRKYVEGVQDYLKRALCRDVKNMQMNEVVYFNDTCGFHVHFSIEDLDLTDTVYYDFIALLRETFFEKLTNSEIINEDSKSLIKESYYRQFASEMPIGEFFGQHGQEFNYSSYIGGKGFEWRSPSLQGIQGWDELTEMVGIITDTIVESLNKRKTTYSEVFACVI